MAGDKGEFMRVMVNPAVWGAEIYILGKICWIIFGKYDGRPWNTYGSLGWDRDLRIGQFFVTIHLYIFLPMGDIRKIVRVTCRW